MVVTVGGIVTDVSIEFRNASAGIDVSPDPMVIEVNWDPAKAPAPKLVVESAMVKLPVRAGGKINSDRPSLLRSAPSEALKTVLSAEIVNDVIPVLAKAPEPILVNEAGSCERLTRFGLLKKALPEISVSAVPKVTPVRCALKNALPPIVVTESGMTTEPRFVPQKALPAMVVTLGGIVTVVRL